MSLMMIRNLVKQEEMLHYNTTEIKKVKDWLRMRAVQFQVQIKLLVRKYQLKKQTKRLLIYSSACQLILMLQL